MDGDVKFPKRCNALTNVNEDELSKQPMGVKDAREMELLPSKALEN